jgi:hypothetical protein
MGHTKKKYSRQVTEFNRFRIGTSVGFNVNTAMKLRHLQNEGEFLDRASDLCYICDTYT